MDNIITVNLDTELCHARRRNLLASGKCGCILPTCIVETAGNFRAVYDDTGYFRLSSLKDISAGDILSLAQKTLECVDDMKEHLFFPDEYFLTPDCVYVSEDLKSMRLAYVPRREKEGERTALSYYIFSLKSLTTSNGKLYLDTLGSLLECRNLKTARVVSFIEELRREINLCSIV